MKELQGHLTKTSLSIFGLVMHSFCSCINYASDVYAHENRGSTSYKGVTLLWMNAMLCSLATPQLTCLVFFFDRSVGAI